MSTAFPVELDFAELCMGLDLFVSFVEFFPVFFLLWVIEMTRSKLPDVDASWLFEESLREEVDDLLRSDFLDSLSRFVASFESDFLASELLPVILRTFLQVRGQGVKLV